MADSQGERWLAFNEEERALIALGLASAVMFRFAETAGEEGDLDAIRNDADTLKMLSGAYELLGQMQASFGVDDPMDPEVLAGIAALRERIMHEERGDGQT